MSRAEETAIMAMVLLFTAILVVIWWPYFGSWSIPFSLVLVILTVAVIAYKN